MTEASPVEVLAPVASAPRTRVSRADVDALAEIVLDRVSEPQRNASTWDIFVDALEDANPRLTVSLRYRNRITEHLESIGYQGTMLQWCQGETVEELTRMLETLARGTTEETEEA